MGEGVRVGGGEGEGGEKVRITAGEGEGEGDDARGGRVMMGGEGG